jgi:integrase
MPRKAARELHYLRVVIVYTDNETSGNRVFKDREKPQKSSGEGVPVRTIQFMLGHKSLETTMRHLGITNLDSLTDKIDAAAADVGD